jgi:hypothetical protein
MFLNKKSQVTMFIILGIVIVAVVFFIFYFLGDTIIKQSEKDITFTESSLEPLKDYVERCVERHGGEALRLIGIYGDLSDNPGTGVMYHYEKINYLCYTENYGACYVRIPFLEKYYEEKIDEYVLNELRSCINLESIRNEGYSVTSGELSVDTNIGENVVIININYPIKISKGDTVIDENRFSKTFEIPLGAILKAAGEIVEYESNPESLPILPFNILAYNLRTLGKVEINMDTIEDSTIYFIKVKNNNYVYRFATRKWVH